MSGFLDRLRGQGKLHKQGEFTLDVEQAGSKLARFQFRDPRDFLYHMVAGLFRLGAEGLDISFKTGILQIGVRGLSLAADTLETLSAALLDPNSAQRRLAAASQSLLGQPLVRFDWVGSARDQVYDYLAGNGKNWATVELQAIRLEGLPTQLVDQACGELEKRASYCRRSLTLHNRPLGRPGGSERMADWPADFECRPGSASQLELVVDEMVTPPKTVTTDFPWHGVCYGEFSLDASLSDVVEDERYQRVVQAIPATYSACLSKVLDNPPRELLGKLLCAPAPAWARPGLWTRLRQLPLFRDQLDRQWSLEKLDELEGPIYFSGDKAPKDLPEVILLEPSACMRACLENQLPGRCQLAGELILRQLRRRLNQQEWRQRPVTLLELPARNWLAQQVFQQSQGRWLIGIPDDWATTGGTVTVLHQGRKVCTRRLEHAEIAFVMLCELEESQFNDVWDDVAPKAWKELEPGWLHCVEEVLKGMSAERAPQGALRTYLIEHLSRSERPQDSYFAKTLLFQDWNDKVYSLYQLLRLGPGQVLGVVDPSQKPVEEWVPLGVYVRSSGWEARVLKKVTALKVMEVGYLLQDLAQARGECQPRQELRRGFGQATIHFFVRGVELEPVKVDSALAYEAWVSCDDLSVQIRQENSRLGLSRYRLVSNPKSKSIIQELTKKSRELPLPEELDSEWLEFLRQANLRNLGWTDRACWPTLRNGLVSLESLLEWPEICWTSGCGQKDYPEQPLLILLEELQQKSLQQVIGGKWKCEDRWFAENERLKRFLDNPTWSCSLVGVLYSEPNWWLSLAAPEGMIFWLFHGRLVAEEKGGLPAGVAAAVECANLDDRPRQGLLEKAGQLLEGWLAQPRPKEKKQIRFWREWEKLSPVVAEGLRRQPWFQTNRGYLSWEDLLQQPALYRVTELNPDLPTEALFVTEEECPVGLLDRLMSQHSAGHSLKTSEEFLAQQKRLSHRRALQKEQQRVLERLAHRQKLAAGELALDPKGSKECWLLSNDQALPIGNLAPGLVGYLDTDEYKMHRQGQRTIGELSQSFRRQLYQELGTLLQARLRAGRLNRLELECFCEILLVEVGQQAGLRFIPCADGSLTSLLQLKLEVQEQGRLLYWPRAYPFCHGGERVTPILSTPLLLELVTRFCGKKPELLPPPLLYQEVHAPSFTGVRRLLSSWGQAVESKLRDGLIGIETRRSALFDSIKPTERKARAAPPPKESRVQLTALRRQAAQLLTGNARREMMKILEKARVGRCRGLWELKGTELTLSEVALKPYFTEPEPPIAITLSLLLSLVSAVNAASEEFTDEMEEKFLVNLTAEVVGSWATSGNARSGEVSRT